MHLPADVEAGTHTPCHPTLRVPTHSPRVGEPLYPRMQARKRVARGQAQGHPMGATGLASSPQSAQSGVSQASALHAEPWQQVMRWGGSPHHLRRARLRGPPRG